MTFAALKSGEQDGWPANNGLSHKGAELLSTIQVGMQAFVQLAQGVHLSLQLFSWPWRP